MDPPKPVAPAEPPVKSCTMYRLATPQFGPEPEWSITHSKKLFPWVIPNLDYSEQECLEKYKKLVPDEFMFNKHIRGESEATYKRIIRHHLKTQGRVTLNKTDAKMATENLI